jgi:hypothetical protein
VIRERRERAFQETKMLRDFNFFSWHCWDGGSGAGHTYYQCSTPPHLSSLSIVLPSSVPGEEGKEPTPTNGSVRWPFQEN